MGRNDPETTPRLNLSAGLSRASGRGDGGWRAARVAATFAILCSADGAAAEDDILGDRARRSRYRSSALLVSIAFPPVNQL
uniref:Uncharacterized protein n=1 Tax=Steinernema glaseri TaxID=37863 RepID=A0A1I7YJH4_9BILA